MIMQILLSKFNGSEFIFTGLVFNFNSDKECNDSFLDMKKNHIDNGKYKLELTNNNHKVIDSIRINSSIAYEISDGKTGH